MPLYEYQCRACSHRFERIQKFSDPLVTLCPQCGKETVEQMISAPAVQFKGSGWYVTDYAKKGTSTTAPAKTEAAAESSASKAGGDGAGSPASSPSSTSSPASSTGGGSTSDKK
jgi:putative FmdB family regulatory protein